MKKLIALILAILTVMALPLAVSAEEPANFVDSINSDFEEATRLEDTAWYQLTNAYGNSKNTVYKDMMLKSGDAYSGNKYISINASLSWHSPSINVHPFFVKAGAGDYQIKFYFRCANATKLSSFLIRALRADFEACEEDDEATFPKIVDKTATGADNYFQSHAGSVTVTDKSGWYLFTSKPFTVSEASLEDEHNWWFCFSNNPVIDIDGFAIVAADESLIVENIETTVTYLDKTTVDNKLPASTPNDKALPTITPEPVAPIVETKVNNITLYVCIAIGAVAVAALVPTVIIKLKKKK